MRKIFCYLIIFIMAGAFTACRKMDHNYSKFVVPGGIVYTQKATAPVAYAGHNRIRLSWLRGTDPTVVKARIFWNNYSDSMEVAIPPAGDTVSAVIDNLRESSYSFVIKTYDAAGNSSVPAEVISTAYGEAYASGLLSRPLGAAMIDTNGTVILQWGAADVSGGAWATEVRYEDVSGEERTQYVPATESVATIPDIMRGTTFRYRTIYFPEPLAIDTFYTSFQENEQFVFDKKDWQVVDVSSEFRADANIAPWVFNGTSATGWYQHSSQVFILPQYVAIDMGYENIITKFEVARVDGDERSYETFQILVSDDNITWTDVGIFELNRKINGPQAYDVPSRPQARYFKFVGLTARPDNPDNPNDNYKGVGEITMYGL